MLSCEQVSDRLSAHIDGELSLRERVALRVHQFMCVDCRVAARNMRALVTSLRDREPTAIADEEAVAEDYIDRVMQNLERERATSESNTGKHPG